jgi:serpin B
MNMKPVISVILAAMLLILSACAPAPVDPVEVQPTPEEPGNNQNGQTPAVPEPSPHTPPSQGAQIQQISSELERQQNPDISGAELTQLVSGNSRFALELYQALKGEEGNLFYSPYSISLALAMTYAGARGETENQIAETLNFTLPQERLHPSFNALDQALAERGERGVEPGSFRLNIVNSLWGQEGYPFRSEYLDTLALNYGAGLRLVDFINQAEASRLLINDWVSEQTEERIEDLLPEGVIDDLTRLVLVNAIYFNARWAYQFEEGNTQDAAFTLLDGSQVTVPTMRQTEILGYRQGSGYEVVELPYDGRELSMIVLLPEEGQFREFEENLDSQTLETALEGIENVNIQLSMPKFTYESEFSLSNQLSALGMPDAFIDRQADFSGMDGNRDLLIKEVIHKAFVAVDEVGTEAAAATAVVVGIESMPPEPVEVSIDRPFIYLIRDIETGTILFLGRVVNPAP